MQFDINKNYSAQEVLHRYTNYPHRLLQDEGNFAGVTVTFSLHTGQEQGL
jgi:hypothetical protein